MQKIKNINPSSIVYEDELNNEESYQSLNNKNQNLFVYNYTSVPVKEDRNLYQFKLNRSQYQ